MIKKIIFLVVLAMGSGTAFAQKFAYVDTDFIMSKIPAYNEAQEKLNGISEDWQKEVEEKYKEVEKNKKGRK